MNDDLTPLIDALMTIGESAHHEYERIPVHLTTRIIIAGRLESGLLGLFVGCANWGVLFPEGMKVPKDPADLDWKGQHRKGGKHLLDGGAKATYDRRPTSRPYGGLGIPHIDSSFLRRDTYGKWGRPEGIPRSKLDDYSFDQILDRDDRQWRQHWLDWATPLLDNPEFHRWSIRFWLSKYWSPAADTFDTLEDIAVNARIGNSASGIAKRLRGGEICECTGDPGDGKMRWTSLNRNPTTEEQIGTYYGYKLAKRGQSSADRAKRQAMQALRVGVLQDVAGFTPL
jgi:hypothetical protein